MKILIVIPARMGSKRLPNKNILPINGIPMFLKVAFEAKKSRYKPFVCVSSESDTIKEKCKENNIFFIKRPKKLSLDAVEKQEVIKHAVKYFLKKKYKPDIVVSLQVNTPEFRFIDLDDAISFFRKRVFIKSKIREVVSIGKDNLQNGAFRIMTLKTVFKKTLSTKIGVFFTDYLDIHYKKDYRKVLKRINKNEKN
jgi:CMP-N-acetylneuraminic acid synthetase